MSLDKNWEIVIGIETHVQLQTASKIFSTASTTFGAAPNSQASYVDCALPGTLPVMNAKAVECAIKFGLAVNAGETKNIARRSVFARKNYFYPDLPKGYQLSQMDLPVVTGGAVTINIDGVDKVIKLTRAHLEEDAGKSFHEGLDTPNVSGIDLNRAGTPLLEVVTEPDMRSALEAVAYAKALHGIVTWIGICDGNMQEGSFRCDANVSVRRVGEPLGTRCEIKNLNSFRFMERAINYEVRRQIELIEDGGKVIQQTRLYDADRDETRAMRSKEDAMDYRYFPCPDLLPLVITEAEIENTKMLMPALQSVAAAKLTAELGIKSAYAALLTVDRMIYDYSIKVLYNSADTDAILIKQNPAEAVSFLIANFGRKRNQSEPNLKSVPVDPDVTARLIARKLSGIISASTAKDLFDEAWDLGFKSEASWHESTVDDIIEARGLRQVSDVGVIEKIVDEVIAANEKSVAEFKSGKDRALQSLVGQVMKASQGKANPTQVNTILREKLGMQHM
jgi:aspartyl-tRNA(Asn)/glutamyl-tRNA(Gln) amidotransferase subunit B